MKKEWVEPKIPVQQFTANEYVAACGDSGKVYKFECNAPAGPLYYYPSSDGTIDGQYNGKGKAKLLGAYQPCKDKHEASATNEFYDGFVDYNDNQKYDVGEGVIVWIEYGKGGRIYDAHATKNLNIDDWETSKS